MDAAPIDADGNLDYKGTNFLVIYQNIRVFKWILLGANAL